MFEFLYSIQVGKLALVDFLIVAGYLLLVLIIGLIYSGKANTFKNYAVGARDFTTSAITATVVATFIDSADLLGLVEIVHSTGFVWVWICTVGILADNLLTMKYIAPRIYYYKDSLSVGEIVSKMYGKKPGLVTAITGLIDAVGSVTLEITAIGIICQMFFGIPPFVGIITGAAIIIIYSFSGGIYAVTITDIIQLFFILIGIPLMLNVTLIEVGSYSNLISSIPIEKFSFDLPDLPLSKVIFLFLIYCIPFVRPTSIQRLLMCRSSKQAVSSLNISSIMYIIFYLIAGGITLLCIYYYPNHESKTVFLKLFDEKLPTIAKGVIITGLLGAIMSTADSRLNSASVIFSNDIIKPLFPKLTDQKLLKIAKFSTILVGLLAIFSSLFFTRLIDIVLTFYSFWLAVATVPLFFGIIGFRASSRTFLTAAACGFSIFLIWKIFGLEEKLGIDHLFLCVLTNSIVFFTLRHFEKDKLPQAFVKVEPYGDKQDEIDMQTTSTHKLFEANRSNQYSMFGIFILVNYFLPFYMWSPDMNHSKWSFYVRVISGILCALLVVVHKFPTRMKKNINKYWYLALFFVLPFSATYFFLDNSGSMLAMANVALSIFLLASLTKWFEFIVILLIGSFLSYQFFMFENPNLVISLNPEQTYVLFYLIIFCSVVGTLFTRQRETLETKVKNLLEFQVAERTQELKEEKVKIEGLNIELQNALTVKQRFLSNFSHEIRSPLSAIFGSADLLYHEWDQLNEEQKYNFVKIVKKGQDRLLALISNLLDLSALDGGNMKFKFEYGRNVIQAVQDAIENYKEVAIEKGQKISLTTEYEILNTKCDYMRIIQVVSNLISNAIKYSDKNSEIKLYVGKQSDDLIEIRVRDEGIGIDENELDKIFEPFTESSKTASLAGGRGVGLTIAKHIMYAHNGQIKAISHYPKKGSEFIITLPIEKETSDEITEVKADNKQKDKGMNIVLVDDDDNVRASEIMTLEFYGHKVVDFQDGIYAIDYIKQHADEIDLVITDLMMPIMKGEELIEELQKDEKTKHIRIAVQSGEYADLDQYLHKGAKAVMEKPYNRESIKNLLDKLAY